jgi:P4 family phage/plasmid primase-like protien
MKLKWTKSFEGSIIGSEFETSEKSAENFVSQGYAEYVKESVKEDEDYKKYKEKEKLDLTPNEKGKIIINVMRLRPKTQRQLWAKLASLPKEEKKAFRDSIQFSKDPGIKLVDEELDFIEKWESIGLDVKEDKKKSPAFIFEREGQVLEFMKHQPVFYDEAGLWWMWSKGDKFWNCLKDNINILNEIRKTIGINTINSKDKTEIINALQQIGREHIPEEINVNCIQFKNKIINIKTDEEFESTPKYFSTNPIPWKIGESEETPTMDRYFNEWVGEKYVKTLYQVIAYSCCSEQFLQRMIALVGGGSNGKGTFIKLLKKFIGKENCISSELALLSSNQFETSTIYKKLMCEMGEVSYDDLKNTNQLKKLAGEDGIRYCFKGKTPFTELSPTTCIINTNSLPKTPDKTTGFYRKWLIIDFPNQFPIKSGFVEKIPDIEFENLAKKCIRILKELYETNKIDNEGDFEERMLKYEQRSNPLINFIEKNCEEIPGINLDFRLLVNKFNEFAQKSHLRVMTARQVSSALKEEGYETGKRTYSTDSGEISSKQVVLNLRFIIKNTENTENTESSNQTPRKELNYNLGISGISGIFTQEKPCDSCLNQAKKQTNE